MTKYAGRGIQVSMNAQAIGQLTAFGEVGSSRDLIDASAYGDDWKDYVLGQQDGNEINMVISLDPVDAGHDAIVTAYDTAPDTPVTFNMTHVDAGLDLDITAILTSVTRGGDLGGLLQMSVNAKIVNPGVVEGS